MAGILNRGSFLVDFAVLKEKERAHEMGLKAGAIWAILAALCVPWTFSGAPDWGLGLVFMLGFGITAAVRYTSVKDAENSKNEKRRAKELKAKNAKEQARMDKIAADKKREANNERIRVSQEKQQALQDIEDEKERLEEEREDAEEAKELALIKAGEVQQWNSNAAKIKAIEAELDADLA